MSRFLWVCFGGALGSGARYLVSGWALGLLGSAFPYGTLAVNVVGSFLIGVIMVLGLNTGLIPPTLRLFLTTGIMGGFTTYSTFNYETLQYLQGGHWLLGFGNILITVLTCLAAGVLGLAGGRWLVGV